MGTYSGILDETLEAFQSASAGAAFRPQLQEYGVVNFVGRGVARVTGLPGAQSEELIEFAGGVCGMVFNLDAEEIGVILLDDCTGIESGTEVRRTHRVLDTPVGEGLLGRVVDPLGRPLDEAGAVKAQFRSPIECDAPSIMERLPVMEPLSTGTKVIDALIPVGRGQRELILGDRQTGKTAIAVDCILNQKDQDVVCIYCAIGRRTSSVAGVIEDLRRRDAMKYSIVVVAAGDSPPGLQFAAPYAAMAMGEYFMRRGRDALIVLDDLSGHARAYRELSLLLRRPPGRESFPGDIFYIHSRLLERSTHLCGELGGGSLTALPIVETEEQNISAYIPTNLISITDGQIYLTPELFRKGILPAVDVGWSVSRVGGKAQLPAYRAVAGDLRLFYSQFEELEVFSRFGSRLDERTRTTLARGRAVREALKQAQFDPLTPSCQIAILLAATDGVFDNLAPERIVEASARIQERLITELPQVIQLIEAGSKLDKEHREAVVSLAKAAVG
ncbi:MAG TPA: alternate F1F0 ATPase, F1 subunit alpha [Bryobacteraceae bacterium]|jgi:F-type H+-transporting ATPase subunit alpha|nr:alternate F1F0 ATPase, F1 subunit alpha [Bryobacteraceae bacterium]